MFIQIQLLHMREDDRQKPRIYHRDYLTLCRGADRWMRVIAEVDDFRERGRAVTLDLARADTETVWISGLPYSRRPSLDQEPPIQNHAE